MAADKTTRGPAGGMPFVVKRSRAEMRARGCGIDRQVTEKWSAVEMSMAETLVAGISVEKTLAAKMPVAEVLVANVLVVKIMVAEMSVVEMLAVMMAAAVMEVANLLAAEISVAKTAMTEERQGVKKQML